MSANIRATTTEAVSTETTDGCPECDGRVRPDGVESVCEECGLVVATDAVDYGRLERWGDEEGDGPRATPTAGVRHHDHGRGSDMGRPGEADDAHTGRLQKWDRRHRRRKGERRLAFGLGEVQRMASALSLPNSTVDAACRVFRDAHATGMLAGRTIEPHATAAVLIATRQADRPLRTEDVTAVARLRDEERTSDAAGPRRVWSAVRRIGVELGIDTTPPDPVAFVARVVADLGLPGRVRRDAERVCRRWQSAGVHGGRDPMGVAGAAVWSVSEVTQNRVGDVAGVSPTTIRKTVREAPDGQTALGDF